jgi:nucleoid DNA-binding protein
MNKSDLIKDVARRTNQSVKDAESVVLETLGSIKNAIETEGEVKILGFGTFKQVTRKARIGRNPSTGQPMQLPEKKVIKFKPYF